jgi:hypothetical protein
MKHIYLSLILVITFLFVSNILINSRPRLNNKSRGVEFIYSDGNNNFYIITKNYLKYVPVNPNESSTGTYSGGKATVKKITKNDFNEFKILTLKLFKSKNQFPITKVKGTGQLSYKKKSLLLRNNSNEKLEIETLLMKLIK